ncbi:MAG: aldo/keto reductase [Pseudomonadota bacterium]
MSHITAPDGTAMSALCYGTMQFGGKADARASREMYDASRAAGINFFDTAFVYTEGASETILGGFIKDERDRLIIATKAGHDGGSGRANLETSFATSQRRLEMDMVDILYLHRWDGETPLEETFEVLAGFQDAGKIRHIGVSNFAAWQVMKAQRVAASFGTRIDIIQPMYSLVKRQAEVELLPMAASEGIAVAPYSPLGGGLLTGKYAKGETGRLSTNEMYKTRYGQDWMHGTAAALTELAMGLGKDAATLAVAWAARNEAVTAPIISATSTNQLTASLAAAHFRLSDEDYSRITALSRAPAPATDRLEEAAA